MVEGWRRLNEVEVEAGRCLGLSKQKKTQEGIATECDKWLTGDTFPPSFGVCPSYTLPPPPSPSPPFSFPSSLPPSPILPSRPFSHLLASYWVNGICINIVVVIERAG